mgnify:CR=1 FL=1
MKRVILVTIMALIATGVSQADPDGIELLSEAYSISGVAWMNK